MAAGGTMTGKSVQADDQALQVAPARPGRPGAEARPIVTVVIPTRNRPDHVRQAIHAALAQSYQPLEILVYVDGTERRVADDLDREFSEARVVWSETPVGVAELRNRGLADARGSMVVNLDDDCYFSSHYVIEQAVAAMNEMPDTAVLGLPLIEPLRERPPGFEFSKAAPSERMQSFLGGANLMRRNAVHALGGYRSILKIGHEERDLAMRIHQTDWVIRYGATDPVVHLASEVRDQRRRTRNDARNMLLIAMMNEPAQVLIPHMVVLCCNLLRYRFQFRDLPVKVKGIIEGVWLGCRHWNMRRPLSWKSWNLLSRMCKHTAEQCASGRLPPVPVRVHPEVTSMHCSRPGINAYGNN